MTTPQKDFVSELEKLNKTCSRISEFLEFLVSSEVEKALTSIFDNPRDMKIYELTDGMHSTRDIGKIIGLDSKGVSRLWQKWFENGIVESTGKFKPYKAKYSLVGLAINNRNIHIE